MIWGNGPSWVIDWEERQRKTIFNGNKIYWKAKTCSVIMHKYGFHVNDKIAKLESLHKNLWSETLQRNCEVFTIWKQWIVVPVKLIGSEKRQKKIVFNKNKIHYKPTYKSAHWIHLIYEQSRVNCFQWSRSRSLVRKKSCFQPKQDLLKI